MAKKQYTPEEYKAKLEKKAEKKQRFSSTFLKVFAFGLAIAMVYCATVIANTRTGLYSLGTSNTVATGSQSTDGGESVDNNDSTDWGDNNTQAPSTDNTDNGDSNNTVNDNSGNTNNNNANTGNEDKSSTNATNSQQEYLDMYKKAVANARANAASVIRVKDGVINYQGIAEAGKLSSIAGTLIGMFMVENEAAIEVENEPWEKESLPDASNLTLNGIQEIKRADQGDTYLIKVVAKNVTNPKAGDDGVGSIAGVIEESQIAGGIASFPGLTLEDISVNYENVTAIATIDKATGNLIAFNIDAPCIFNIGYAKFPLVGEINNARIGVQIITEYAISY